ncbi:MAG: methyltransferase domain-containing protein [Thermoleophilaceae bacterium]|nr:methyltransferase domain-containing protein [Thermoleophilaceae bacterium]
MDLIAYQQTIAVENDHWWYRGRRLIVNSTIRRLNLPPAAQILDAGCGSGRNMVELARLGTVFGAELDSQSAEIAKRRDVGEIVQCVVETMPFEPATFDLITCLDVIEHVKVDSEAFRELLRVAKPGGFLVVTVPAYKWLWSHHDVVNQHYRRYTHARLKTAALAEGWQCIRTGYFNSIMLPLAAIVRLSERVRPKSPDHGLDLDLPPRMANRLLEFPLKIENLLIRCGIRLPAGVSVIAVFQRPENNSAKN